jgi:hypothetical protein
MNSSGIAALQAGSSTSSGVAAFPFADGRPIVPVAVLIDVDAGNDRGSPKNLTVSCKRVRRTGVYLSEIDEIHFARALAKVAVSFIARSLLIVSSGGGRLNGSFDHGSTTQNRGPS